MANPEDSSSPPDHRDLGNVLDLFHFQDEAPGMVFWHPRGLILYDVLCDAARRRCRCEGYSEVRTPPGSATVHLAAQRPLDPLSR
jgi:threonyl-tRNA synthetase